MCAQIRASPDEVPGRESKLRTRFNCIPRAQGEAFCLLFEWTMSKISKTVEAEQFCVNFFFTYDVTKKIRAPITPVIC